MASPYPPGGFDKPRRFDLEILGFGMAALGSAMAFAMWAPADVTGAFGLTVRPIFFLAGDLAWTVPAYLVTIGSYTAMCSPDAEIVSSLSLTAWNTLLFTAALLHVGSVGNGVSWAYDRLLGVMAPYVLGAQLALVLYAGIHFPGRATLRTLSRLIVRGARWFWEIRVPGVYLPELRWPKWPRRRKKARKWVPSSSVSVEPIPLPGHVPGIPDAVYREEDRSYRLPSLDIFSPPATSLHGHEDRGLAILEALSKYGVTARITGTQVGPAITRYEVVPADGVRLSKIADLARDLAMRLAAPSVRIEPVPGKAAVGLEIPNRKRATVSIRELLEGMPRSGLPIALGKDIAGKDITGDLREMPHLLVAGATGAGKSVCLNAILASLLSARTPDELRLLMIDPKQVELSVYDGIPHLLRPVITDPRAAADALTEVCSEMDRRYKLIKQAKTRKLSEYNAKNPSAKLPEIVVVIDELADLMLIAAKQVEPAIIRLTQLARAAGIHLVVATQRPSADIITPLIRSNVPSRIAFAVADAVNSRIILDVGGAEDLLGNGDMLYLPAGQAKPVRAQGAMITSAEVERLVDHWSAQPSQVSATEEPEGRPYEPEEVLPAVDPMIARAARHVVATGSAAAEKLRAYLGVRREVVGKILDQLEGMGIVGPAAPKKARQVLVDKDDLNAILGGAPCSR